MTIYDRLKEANLIDQFGLVTLVGNPDGTDNGVLYSAHYFLACSKAREGIDPNHVAVLTAVAACLNKGNPLRKPGDYSQNSPDNAIGLSFCNRSFAETMLNYPKFLYNYNTTNPGKLTLGSWFGRQPGLIGFMQVAAGGWINPLRVLVLLIGIYMTSCQATTNTSDRLLANLMIELVGNPILKHWWQNKLKKQYKNGINDVYATYFGPAHVFSELDWA